MASSEGREERLHPLITNSADSLVNQPYFSTESSEQRAERLHHLSLQKKEKSLFLFTHTPTTNCCTLHHCFSFAHIVINTSSYHIVRGKAISSAHLQVNIQQTLYHCFSFAINTSSDHIVRGKAISSAHLRS